MKNIWYLIFFIVSLLLVIFSFCLAERGSVNFVDFWAFLIAAWLISLFWCRQFFIGRPRNLCDNDIGKKYIIMHAENFHIFGRPFMLAVALDMNTGEVFLFKFSQFKLPSDNKIYRVKSIANAAYFVGV